MPKLSHFHNGAGGPIIDSSANPVMEIQPDTLILGSNMSSGVTVPNFGKKFAKLRQCEQFEVQENSSENKASV